MDTEEELQKFRRLELAMNRPFLAIFWGGLLCGILDLTSAFVAYVPRGVAAIRIPQSVASGLLGPAAFEGGAATAALGICLHFTIALVAAAVFYAASRRIRFLTAHPFISGLLYGEVVYAFMNLVVLPLSAIHRWPPSFTFPALIAGLLGHPFVVGWPIALAVRKFGPNVPAE
jgi:hypothetical protein